MNKFGQYFLMNTNDVIEYAKAYSYFTDKEEVKCQEIGDGNLNYVFRVYETKDNYSLIIKQAGTTARISSDFKLSTDRSRIEAEILQMQEKNSPGLVPKVYKYDPIMSLTVMEDLKDFTIMRTALCNRKIFPNFADHITTFLVNNLLLTSDIVLDHKRKKEIVKKFINPELCEITEDLVYTEPFNNCKNRNILFEENKEWIQENIYNDKKLRLEAAKLKFEFMNNAQSLLHGDLHTGSIFINEFGTKIIDPEFAFYGPMGYDIGNIIANLIFAWVNGTVQDADKQYIDWLEETISNIFIMFTKKFGETYKDKAADIMANEEGFYNWYISKILSDTAGVVGLEIARRIIGIAKVKDITSIESPQQRLLTERICLSACKQFIFDRDKLISGQDYLNILKRECANGHI